MTENTEMKNVLQILKEARFARKGDYRTYETFKQRIDDLNLPWEDRESALRQLAQILRV